MVGMTHPEV